MSRVFRFHQGKDIEDWQVTSGYSRAEIEGMKDPAGDMPKRPITSIPSPFARIDLFKTAFKSVADSKDLDGSKSYHKLVSDALDVAEIVFNAELFGDRLKVIPWSPDVDLKRLSQSQNAKHRHLADTLGLYLAQDAEAYNFDKIKRLYVFEFDFKVIGGTSPSTLFYSSANDLSTLKVRFGNDFVFDPDYRPLYRRDPEFQKYLHLLFETHNDLMGQMKELHSYLTASLERLQVTQPELFNEIKASNAEELGQRYRILNCNADNDPVEVLGVDLRCRIEDPSYIETTSDFVIGSTLKGHGALPLVLQRGFTKLLRYTRENWDPQIDVPYTDPEPDISKRHLPGVGNLYPYLVVSDLLKDHIVRLPYDINADEYFVGNTETSNSKEETFLLPLQPLFFEYFTVDDLIKGFDGSKKPVIISRLAGGVVKVTLNIPLRKKGEFVSLERKYYPQTGTTVRTPNEGANEGIIVDRDAGFTVLPAVRLKGVSQRHYRIMLIDRDRDPDDVSLRFHDCTADGMRPLESGGHQRRKKGTDGSSTIFFALESDFNLIEMVDRRSSGYVVPKFREVTAGEGAFTFAIDFGTTYTHIEYKRDNEKESHSFDLGASEHHIATLHKSDDIPEHIELVDLVPQELVPRVLSPGSKFGFPQRTAIGEYQGVNLSVNHLALGDLNIPFIYEKESISTKTNIVTNLKWSNYVAEASDLKRIEAYFEEILFLIRNKVILNGGNLARTKIIWFYPSSMLRFRKSHLAETWRKAFAKYIGAPDQHIIGISESLAPFYYYKNDAGITSYDKPVVSIDIGGGTTDIVVFSKDKPKALTSFAFAANTVFGDGYGGSARSNGFIQKCSEHFRKTLGDQEFTELAGINEQLIQTQRSEDIIAFWFSLGNNQQLKKKGVTLSLHDHLANDTDMKIVFLIFFGAVMYHVAHLLRSGNLEIPKRITFSGTGSKILNILEPGGKFEELNIVAMAIFKEVFGVPEVGYKLELTQAANPKEITCKGALSGVEAVDIDEIKTVLLGASVDLPNDASGHTYGAIHDSMDEYKTAVVKEVREYISVLKKVNQKLNLTGRLGANLSENLLATLNDELMESFEVGFDRKFRESQVGTESQITETLFFYPLIGSLARLAREAAGQSR